MNDGSRKNALPFFNLYLFTRPDRVDPTVDSAEFRRRVFPALLSHLYIVAIAPSGEAESGREARAGRWL